MKATIYIPKKLEDAVKSHLEIHPEQTLSSLVQGSLENKLMPKKSRLLELAGFVEFTSKSNGQEQIADNEQEFPEDKSIKRKRES
jgi:hypothetical protein